MTWQKITRAFSGITPLGKFTITPGTPQNILANTSLPTVRYSMQCRQVGISVSSTVAGEVYLNYGNIAGLGNQTALVVQSSQIGSLPNGDRTSDSMVDAAMYYLDGSAACVCTVYLLDATSS
jgi:hypothetical protein